MADPFLVNTLDPAQIHGQVGQTTVNMAGQVDATATITGQAGINANAVVRAWLVAVDTSTHSADEHWVDGPRIYVGTTVPGVGFTIYATRDDLDTGAWTVNWEWKN